ncbi:MAG: hypothetical protein HQ488_01205 [Parcubacteria group bacterium]|nr:hypothetical protein [Parcubacteria group bacterium]
MNELGSTRDREGELRDEVFSLTKGLELSETAKANFKRVLLKEGAAAVLAKIRNEMEVGENPIYVQMILDWAQSNNKIEELLSHLGEEDMKTAMGKMLSLDSRALALAGHVIGIDVQKEPGWWGEN